MFCPLRGVLHCSCLSFFFFDAENRREVNGKPTQRLAEAERGELMGSLCLEGVRGHGVEGIC